MRDVDMLNDDISIHSAPMCGDARDSAPEPKTMISIHSAPMCGDLLLYCRLSRLFLSIHSAPMCGDFQIIIMPMHKIIFLSTPHLCAETKGGHVWEK